MSIISISATKAQKEGAKYLFGTKGESILAVLEALAKAKELRTPHLTGLVAMLKDAEDDELIKFKSSPAGKRTIESAKQLATAKTLVTSIKALRGIKVSSKWVQNHDDVKASGAEETKTHRATGRPTKPKKGDTLTNPQAPEPETITRTSTDASWVDSVRKSGGKYRAHIQWNSNMGGDFDLTRNGKIFTSSTTIENPHQRWLTDGINSVKGAIVNITPKSFEFKTEAKADAFEAWLKQQKTRRLIPQANNWQTIKTPGVGGMSGERRGSKKI